MSFPDEREPGPPPDVNRKMIRKFREQIHALGALWIFLGSVAGVIGVIALLGNPGLVDRDGDDQQLLLGFIAATGFVWFVLGVLTCLKQMWAVYVALALSYLSMLGQILNLNICGCVILILVILQAHRVIGWASQMRAAGVPLTAKPR